MTDDVYKLATEVIRATKEQDLTIATAESCTGGGIGAALTAIPGSSDVFQGGIIAYANDVKINQLAVSEAAIESHGAVSEQVAIAMADGARNALNTDIAISVTGIAGPTGGTKDKPIGTVWIGLAHKGKPTTAQHFLFADDSRKGVRRDTVEAALAMLEQVMKR